MDWHRDLPTWPLSQFSKRVSHRPHQWHVQETGSGETLLLLHGAGASTHSWRDLIPLLAEQFHVVAIDLPGQGFTRLGSRGRCGLAYMTEDILSLCDAQGWRVRAVIGHSASAAIALCLAERLAAEGHAPPEIIAINAALGRFEGMASWLFPLLAKVLALNPLTALFFSMGRNHEGRARRLIESTGSHLDEAGLGYYARLIADQSHLDGTLQMMSQWNTDALNRRFESITARALLITGQNDLAVAPRISAEAAERLPNARHLDLPKLGHLAHEEDPTQFAEIILSWLDRP